MTGERSEYTGREIMDVVDEVDLYDASGNKIGDVLEISTDTIIVDTGDGSGGQRFPLQQTTRMDNGRDLQLTGSYGSSTGGGHTSSSTAHASTDSTRVAVHEEELQASKRVQEAGEVEVRKNVVEEERTINVPVMREEVEVVRRPVDGSSSGTASPDAFQGSGESVRVPLHEEVVDVTKTPQVVEEIELRKKVSQDTEQVTDTVRKEQVEVVEDDRGISR